MKATGSTIAFTYLPTILQRKNTAINVSVEQTYTDYLIVYSPGIAAIVLSVFMVRAPMVGRKWTLVFSSMATGISLFLFSVVNTQASEVGFNMLEYFCQTLFNAAVSSGFFFACHSSERYHRSSSDGLLRRSLLRSGGLRLVWPRFLAACVEFVRH